MNASADQRVAYLLGIGIQANMASRMSYNIDMMKHEVSEAVNYEER